MRSPLFVVGVLLLCAARASAQAPGNPSPEIVVHGQRDPAQVQQFVHQMSAQMSVGQLARWNDEICPGVLGASADQAQMLIDQVARRAAAVGLRVGRTGCPANLTILVTPDAQNVVQSIYRQRRVTLINPNNVDGATLGEAALQDFVNTPRPVRWWHIAQKTTDDGRGLTDTRAAPLNNTSAAVIAQVDQSGEYGSSSSEGMSTMQGIRSNGSRLVRTTREDFNSVLVVIDTARLNGAPLSAVADYVAFVSLVQVNPSADTSGLNSILNLFNASSGATRPTQLTSWDIDYLDGLYHATRSARNIGQQESEIARRMSGPRS